MAVVYMKKLEQEPSSYDSQFTTLTKGINLKVQDWILDKLNKPFSILEIGCGTGNLASKMASKGNKVIAIDSNFQMINHAMQNYPNEINQDNLLYQIGTFTNMPVEDKSQDLIVSTFMLSELRPFEQQIFLRNTWRALKPDGRIIIAAEFLPKGIWKIIFKIKRWRYRKKLRRLRLKSTFLIKWFFNYIEPIGFKILNRKEWKHGSIQVLELQKINENENNEPGYYRPKSLKYRGLLSQFKIFRCTLTGQVDHVPIEPGIYQSGNPDSNSPLIVTANYQFTFIKVMRDIKNIDAWVLVVDSNGINVWCAARGPDFGNLQLLEAVEATDIKNKTSKKTMILPQLSAGGVSTPELPKKTEKFPFNVVFGPVWSKDLPDYIQNRPGKKPDHMKLAKFTISHRLRGFITHTTFLIRKIFIYPLIALTLLFLILMLFNPSLNLFWVGEIAMMIIVTNFLIAVFFPLFTFTRRFILKGTFFGITNNIILGGVLFLLHNSIFHVLWNSSFIFWVSFFSTMSFSGYSMATSPREIQAEYPLFSLINKILLGISVITLIIGIFFI
jgi:ubiquinone/menaquinone biosynthesis C-methylase UbiE